METDILTQCSGRSAALHLRSHSSLCSLRCALLSNLSHWSEYSISYAGVLMYFILLFGFEVAGFNLTIAAQQQILGISQYAQVMYPFMGLPHYNQGAKFPILVE